MKKYSSEHIFSETKRKIFNYLFQISLVLYLGLLLLKEFINISFNINYLLIPTIVLGAITAIFPYEKKDENVLMKTSDKILVITLGLVGGFLIFIKTKNLGWLSYVISTISGLLITLLGFLVYSDDDQKEKISDFKINHNTVFALILILIVISIVLYSYIGLNAFRIVFGSVFVLFVPGLIISYLFFDKLEIEWLERVALSFALSISIVPLLVFYLNLLGMKMNVVNVSILIIVIDVISYIAYKYKQKWKR